MHLSELKTQHVTQLVEMAVGNQIENASRMRKQDLIFALLKGQAKKGESIFGDCTLEVLPDGFGFLRSPDTPNMLIAWNSFSFDTGFYPAVIIAKVDGPFDTASVVTT